MSFHANGKDIHRIQERRTTTENPGYSGRWILHVSFHHNLENSRSASGSDGTLEQRGQWDHLGALYPEMVEKHSKGWMLPSSQLIFGESPRDAAQRILLEQLGLSDQKLEEPRIFSEVWGPRGHWDLEFLFLGERERSPTHPAWRELKFVDLASTKKEDIARSHEDILAHVGLWKTTQ